MTPQYGHVYLADLNPRFGTEPGKVRPVIVVQTDALNPYHLSTLICPLTTQGIAAPTPLRVSIPQGITGLTAMSDILVDQIKAIDNQRFRKELGALPDPYLAELRKKLLQILDFVEESLSSTPPT
ncbi:MAG: type II toxin-antitoxin system PemK/MazF family toxin [Nitrospirota bacterium]|nr:type II toxin-antitoxin system PemK/MazF family toxin [Nitrospirota bacterium]MDX2419879.1 type II toxin-antitoxin system PemK/MazF family toxin [Nitrospirota bacterium]